MGQDLRLEDGESASFITARTVNSTLWFQNNKALENKILAHLAKYQEKYSVDIYAFVMMSNHYHLLANFPLNNRAAFMRDLNSAFSRLTRSHVKEFEGGALFGRRYRPQAVILEEDYEQTFVYAALNPVNSGLVETLSDYPGYNSYQDAILGEDLEFTLVNQREFHDKRRYNKNLKVEDFTKTYTLKYARLPGYEHMPIYDYQETMFKKIEIRRIEIVQKRRTAGKGFAGTKILLNTKPGTKPQTTKTSTRDSVRPLVICVCEKTKKAYLEKYFNVRQAFTEAFKAIRKGIKNALFPPGTYHPPLMWISR